MSVVQLHNNIIITRVSMLIHALFTCKLSNMLDMESLPANIIRFVYLDSYKLGMIIVYPPPYTHTYILCTHVHHRENKNIGTEK